MLGVFLCLLVTQCWIEVSLTHPLSHTELLDILRRPTIKMRPAMFSDHNNPYESNRDILSPEEGKSFKIDDTQTTVKILPRILSNYMDISRHHKRNENTWNILRPQEERASNKLGTPKSSEQPVRSLENLVSDRDDETKITGKDNFVTPDVESENLLLDQDYAVLDDLRPWVIPYFYR